MAKKLPKEALSRLSETEYREVLSDLREIGHTLEDRGVIDLAERVLDRIRQMTSQTLLEGVPPTNVLRDLDLFLRDQKIDYAIIGGIAVGVHGVPRGTDDIDVLVERLPEPDVLRRKDFMSKFGFYTGRSSTGTVLTLDHRQGQTEMLVVIDELKRYALMTAKKRVVLGIDVKVIGADALIAMKVRALLNDSRRLGRDSADVVTVWSESRPDLTDVMKLLTLDERSKLTDLINNI